MICVDDGRRRRAIRDGNVQKVIFNFFSLETGSSSKLSTFSSAGKASSGVQMRKQQQPTANKKGKTAPAPPKRTR
jgi:hypothetical protein